MFSWTFNTKRFRRLPRGGLLVVVAVAALPAADAFAASRGVAVRAGSPYPEPSWNGEKLSTGPAWAHVTVSETSFGSTQMDPSATHACVEVYRETTHKRATTRVYDRGCGPLELRGMATGAVTITGSVTSDSGSGTLTVEARSVRASAPALALPVGWCGGGWMYIPCPDLTRPKGVYRTAEHEGAVTSSRAGTFDLAVLGGPTVIWELY